MATRNQLRTEATRQFEGLKTINLVFGDYTFFANSEGYGLAALALKVSTGNPHRVVMRKGSERVSVLLSPKELKSLAEQVATYLDDIGLRYSKAITTIDNFTESQLASAKVTV